MIGIYGTSDRALVLASALALKDKEVFIYAADEEALEEITDGHLKQFHSPVDSLFRKADKSGNLSYSGNLQTLLNCEIVFLSGRIVRGETDPKEGMRFIIQDTLTLLRKAVNNRKVAKDLNLVLIDQLPYQGYQALTETIFETTFEPGEDILEDNIEDSAILPVVESGEKKNLQINLGLSPVITSTGDLTSFVNRPGLAVIGSESQELIGRLKEIYKSLGVSKRQIFVSDPEAVDDSLILKDAFELMLQTFINEAAQFASTDLFYELIKTSKIPTVSFQIDNRLVERIDSLKDLSPETNLFNQILTYSLKRQKELSNVIIKTINDYYSDKNPEEITISLVGLAQNPGSNDMRGAQVIDLISELAEKGFKLHIYMKEGITDLKWRLRKSNDQITYFNEFNTSIKDTNILVVLGKVGHPVDLKRISKGMKDDPVLYDPFGIFAGRKDLNLFSLI